MCLWIYSPALIAHHRFIRVDPAHILHLHHQRQSDLSVLQLPEGDCWVLVVVFRHHTPALHGNRYVCVVCCVLCVVCCVLCVLCCVLCVVCWSGHCSMRMRMCLQTCALCTDLSPSESAAIGVCCALHFGSYLHKRSKFSVPSEL